LGEASRGLLAIDVDGASALPILEAMIGDIPQTCGWTSGKVGRQQLLFQVPDELRDALSGFTRAVITEWEGLKTVEGELLEFRYNRCQSALPPSFHPDTGGYKWMTSPNDAEVKGLPHQLCEIILKLAEGEGQKEQGKSQSRGDREKAIQASAERRKALGIIGSSDLFDCFAQSVARLSPEEIFNWSGHNFKVKGGEWFGCCPQHSSASGESFTVKPEKLDWYCYGCGIGGGVGEYRHFVNGGSGTPKGKDFFAITKALAEQARVELPKAEKTESKPEAVATKERTFQQKSHDEWKSRKQFTATHKINPTDGYFKWEVPPPNSALFVKSGLGTGKTTWLRELIAGTKDGRWMSIGYRNTLLIQFCAKRIGQANTGMIHIHDQDGALLLKDVETNIAFCADSILKFHAEDFDGCNLIFDEFTSILRHVQTSPTIKWSAKVLRLLEEAIKRAKRIICLDGNMADWAVDWIREIDPTKQTITVENVNKKVKSSLTFLIGTQDEDEKIKPNDNSPFSKLMFAENARTVIGDDSQVECETLDNLYTALGKKVLRVDSKTISMGSVKEFLEDCDEYIRKYQPDVVIYSPSAESGVDISIKEYFTQHICLFHGALKTDSQLQMIGRVRDVSVPKFVWCRERVYEDGSSDSNSPLANQIFAAKAALMIEEIDKLDSLNPIEYADEVRKIINRGVDCHYKAWSILSAIYNYEKTNLRACLLERLKASDYQVDEVILDTCVEEKAKVKEMKKEVKIKTSEDIFNAPQIPIDSDDESRRFDATWEEQAKTIQAGYRKRLPGIETTESWSVDLIYKFRYGNPKFISQCELFYFFENPKIARSIQIEKYHRLTQLDYQYQALGRFHSPYATCEALEALGIRKLMEGDLELTNDSPEVKEIVRRGRDKKISDTLGKYPGKDGVKYVNSVLSIIGLGLKKGKKKVQGKTIRFYKFDRELASDLDRINALKCLENRYLPKTAETLEGHGVEGVALCSNSLIKPVVKCHLFEEENQGVNDGSISAEVTQTDVLTPAEELAELLTEFAGSDSVESYEMFYSLTEFSPANVVEAAIIAAPSAWLRRQWANFYEAIAAPRHEAELAAMADF
jgi:hypothetical protein